MELVNSNDERLFLTSASYQLYLIFISVLSLMVLRFKQVLKANSIKPIRITLVLLLVNFFVAYLGAQGIIPFHPMVFYIMFYATMISVPGALLYTFNYIHDLLISDNITYLPL